ncbi:hypothetical protein LFWB_1520 [Candidatus Phytoplasma luffae]|uniref:Effector n=1 Tax=Loofah witches'-broom phytoplasma TaxID=35773 RepID=A0A975ILS5_LOWBP|nr:hypothetical protein [Candidatus Phytoplasma luffae]QTX02722.1 hypothetical protein LFWB_1520 [Candidatus Phytoplasma luffae]
MNNNFFQKHLVTIVITSLFGIAIIIGFYQGINDVKQEENIQLYNFENADKNVQNEINQSIEKIQHFENQINLLEKQLKTKLINSSQFFINFYGGITDLSNDQFQKEISNDINSIMDTIETLKEHDLHSYLFDLAHQLSQDIINSSKNRVENSLSDIEEKLKKLTNKINSIQSKFQTTQKRLDQIKSYVLSEPTNYSLLPSDLSEREKTQINKLKNSWQLSLNLLKKEKTGVDEKQTECDEYQAQLNSLQPQIEALKPQQQKLEQDQADKNKIINQKKEVRGQFKYLPNQPEEVRKKREENKRILEAEIDKLQDEEIKIVGEIEEIEVQIGILEADQKMYQNMLTRAEGLKKDLEERYKEGEKQYKDSIISGLNELYDITSAEG